VAELYRQTTAGRDHPGRFPSFASPERVSNTARTDGPRTAQEATSAR